MDRRLEKGIRQDPFGNSKSGHCLSNNFAPLPSRACPPYSESFHVDNEVSKWIIDRALPRTVAIGFTLAGRIKVALKVIDLPREIKKASLCDA